MATPVLFTIESWQGEIGVGVVGNVEHLAIIPREALVGPEDSILWDNSDPDCLR